MTLQEYTTYAVPNGAPALPEGVPEGPKAVENFVISLFKGCSEAEETLNERNGSEDNTYRWSINEDGEFRGNFRAPVDLAAISAA